MISLARRGHLTKVVWEGDVWAFADSGACLLMHREPCTELPLYPGEANVRRILQSPWSFDTVGVAMPWILMWLYQDSRYGTEECSKCHGMGHENDVCPHCTHGKEIACEACSGTGTRAFVNIGYIYGTKFDRSRIAPFIRFLADRGVDKCAVQADPRQMMVKFSAPDYIMVAKGYLGAGSGPTLC